MQGYMFIIVFVPPFIDICDTVTPANCTLKANLPCWMHTKYDQCSHDELQRWFPELYVSPDTYPGRASHFDANIFYGSSGPRDPGVNLSFAGPNDGSLTLLKGFQMERRKSNKPGSIICYIFDLSSATWALEDDTNVVFSLPIAPISTDVIYMYDLYTLPRQHALTDQSRHVAVTAPKYEDSNVTERWRTEITFAIYQLNGTVDTEFSLPPPEYGFEQVNVTLWNANEQTAFIDQTSETIHQFLNVTPGVYQIWVQPAECETCAKSATLNFTIIAPVPMTTSTSVEPTSTLQSMSVVPTTSYIHDPARTTNNSSTKILASVLGALAGVVIAGTGAAVYWYCYRPGRYNLKPKKLNCNANVAFDNEIESVITLDVLKGGGNLQHLYNNANTVQFEKRKKLFILYEDDHGLHRLVVERFATYLSAHCQCDVAQADLQHDAPWVHQDVEQADLIVIVNSEAAYKAYVTCFTQETVSRQHAMVPSINSVGNRLVNKRLDNVIMVYLSYTDEKFILPDVCTGYTYKLMNQFTEFLLRVHNLHRTDNLAQYDLPLDGNHNLRPAGQKLIDAIKKATQFEAEHPNWHVQAQGIRQRSESNQPPLVGSCIPVEHTMESQIASYNVTSSRLNDTRSVVTVTESQLNAYSHYPTTTPIKHDSPTVLMPQKESLSDKHFDFIEPDLDSNFDKISTTQSKQLEGIVNTYTDTLNELNEEIESFGPQMSLPSL